MQEDLWETYRKYCKDRGIRSDVKINEAVRDLLLKEGYLEESMGDER